MLKNHSSSAIIAVKDYNRAKRFYRDTLKLDLIEEFMGQVMTFQTGDTLLNVYMSDYAGSNKANAVVWGVGEDLDDIVAELKASGVAFEHYPDNEYMRLEGDIHVSG